MKLTPRQQRAKDRYMRKKYAIDLIQPCENRFKRWYPKQYAQMEKAREQQEIKAKKEKESKDEFLRENRHNIIEKRKALNALKLEEKLEYGKK